MKYHWYESSNKNNGHIKIYFEFLYEIIGEILQVAITYFYSNRDWKIHVHLRDDSNVYNSSNNFQSNLKCETWEIVAIHKIILNAATAVCIIHFHWIFNGQLWIEKDKFQQLYMKFYPMISFEKPIMLATLQHTNNIRT